MNLWDGTPKEVVRIASDCPMCERPLKRVRMKSGDEFTGCTGYPACRFTEPVNWNIDRVMQRLNGAESDVEYYEAFVHHLKSKIHDLKEHSHSCPLCAKHLEELERLL